MSFFRKLKRAGTKVIRKAEKTTQKATKATKKVAQKATKDIQKITKNVAKEVEKGAQEATDTTNKVIKESDKLAQQGLNELEKGADLAKKGLEETGDFILNSSERDYWNKEISSLTSRLNKLREELESRKNTLYQTKVDYQEKYYQYLMVNRDTVALGLISSQDLAKVSDAVGIVVDMTRSFSESSSEIEEIGRYALGFISAGISDIILASQEAEKEAEYLRKQVSAIEKKIAKVSLGITQYEEEILQLEQVTQSVLSVYGNNTTMDNFIQKQCELIYARGSKKAHQDIEIRI